ncbi:MAG: N-6 DNA methylase [Chlorobi bacterium]|nr:N-6 DNA methylase [Chlorobiota bacterium]
MDNQQGLSEHVREVVHEYSLKTPDGSKAPDYGFRIGKDLKFFLEAKKPSVKIKEDHTPAFQLRSYAWNAKLPVSILSDFEEFAIYDCRFMPDRLDRASVARMEYFTFSQLPEKWEWLTNTFSKQAIVGGAFDKYAETTRAKRGTIDVDDAFLAEIEQWRELLAADIAKRNRTLTVTELNDAVQRTIDRIIFLRIAEDRGIEEYGKLQSLTNGKRIYPRLLQIFHQADARYNSGLFHFRKEKGQTEEPDNLTTELEVSDEPLQEIFRKLYYPSPYRFHVMPASVLGQVYEQFLGKVITLDKKHHATVELKPEVRKAGGVYYTPEYIARYIVENTIGRLINRGIGESGAKNITPSDVAKLHFLDPACGSGSFLLVAYDFLLDWHLNFYSDNPKKWSAGKNAVIYKADDGWRLTTAEKRRILLNNIYGVDIDRQAVEVTKLSLLLKVLEGESDETLGRQMALVHQRVLPDLGNNIKCGNSLISSDFYDTPANADLDLETRKRINAFDWEHEFPEIMKGGGFDAVIGNPPWIDIKGLPNIDVKYYFAKFSTVANRMNIYAVFIEKSIHLLNREGILGFITPSSFLTQSSYFKLRVKLLDHGIREIIKMPDNVFKRVIAECAVLILAHGALDEAARISIFSPNQSLVAIDRTMAQVNNLVFQDQWNEDSEKIFNLHLSSIKNELINKIVTISNPLSSFCEFCLGLTPYDKYKGHTEYQIKNRVFHSNTRLDNSYKPLIKGADIQRFIISDGGDEYIKYGEWLGAPREKRFFIERRIVVRQIVSGNPLRIYAGYTSKELYNTQIGFNILLREERPESLLFILGVVNSWLMSWFHREKYLDPNKQTFQKILIQDAKNLPIKSVNLIDKGDSSLHDKIVMNVEKIIDVISQTAKAKTPQDKKFLQRQIEQTDRKIDQLVYELYGLSEEEIAIVEGEGQ